MTGGPALGLLEVSSIARGIVCADAIVKRAKVALLRAEAVSPGKYVILIHGGVAEVEESMAAGVGAAKDALLDRLVLPQAHAQLAPVVAGEVIAAKVDSVGVVETASVASCILAADAACKAADVRLLLMRLAKGIGGKGYFTLTGALHMVEAAVAAAAGAVDATFLVGTEIIPAPHGDLGGTAL
jgi:microcompartment protein CcmL/EutN